MCYNVRASPNQPFRDERNHIYTKITQLVFIIFHLCEYNLKVELVKKIFFSENCQTEHFAFKKYKFNTVIKCSQHITKYKSRPVKRNKVLLN